MFYVRFKCQNVLCDTESNLVCNGLFLLLVKQTVPAVISFEAANRALRLKRIRGVNRYEEALLLLMGNCCLSHETKADCTFKDIPLCFCSAWQHNSCFDVSSANDGLIICLLHSSEVYGYICQPLL